MPATIVYDRTKTVVRRHVGRGRATPLHPEAVAFASHYNFAIWLAAPYRAQTKGRVERQVEIVRSHVLAGRSFASLGELDAAFAAWLPHRRAQVHRTHGEVIAVRAERDRAALGPLPAQPYLVCERHTRRVGKDALISFAASHYSVPWRKVRPGGRVELRVTPAEVAIWSLGPRQQLLATHPRAAGRGGWVVDQAHWEGLADRVDAQPLPPCADDCELAPPAAPEPGQLQLPGIGGWASSPAARILVAQRRLAVYDQWCRSGWLIRQKPGAARQCRPADVNPGGQLPLSETDRQESLTPPMPSGYIDGMEKPADPGVATLTAATSSRDPEVGLRAVAALHGLLEVVEALQVDNARAQGWSWQDIASRLGVSKQAVHQKHSPRARTERRR